MKARRTHRILGLLLLLPICGWALTGFVFFLKPGYKQAYASLRVKAYPLDPAAWASGTRVDLSTSSAWLETRSIRTILGDHLLVRTSTGWRHLDPSTMRERPLPDESSVRALLTDAVASEIPRYGSIATIARQEGEAPSAAAKTSTGASIELDWATLTLTQSGEDTRRIDTLYKIHYLQWTGFAPIDRILGLVGLISLVALALLGLRLSLGR